MSYNACVHPISGTNLRQIISTLSGLIAPRRQPTSGILSVLVLLAGSQLAFAQSIPTLSPESRAAVLGNARAVKRSKLTNNLFDLRQEYILHQQLNQGEIFDSANVLIDTPQNFVVVDAVATSESTVNVLIEKLEALGMRNIESFGRVISGEFPLTALTGVDRIQELTFMRPAIAVSRTGSVTSQGDTALFSNNARAALGVDGTGATIGTLSDSYDCLSGAAADIASGDLPAAGDISILSDFCPGGTDEGRAMMQIIHDIAPGAQQAFHTATGGSAAFANNIIDLQSSGGSDVIVDDVFYFDEPFFQDGPIAQAVDTVVGNGASYFSSAGNSARNSFEGAFDSTGQPYLYAPGESEVHDFDSGAGVDIVQNVTVPIGESISIVLQWNEPAASAGPTGATRDLELYVTNFDGTAILAPATSINIGGDPTEVIHYTNTSGSDQLGIVIEQYLDVVAGGPMLMKFIYFGNLTINEYDTSSSTVVGHTNASGAFSVGAANYAATPAFGIAPPLAETFSSSGRTTILFDGMGNPVSDVRDNPDFIAPDNVNTTFFGFDNDADGFPNFAGTSASAPHAAGVAALYREKVTTSGNTFANAVLENRLELTAVDMDAAGEDDNTGFGLIHAENALSDPTIVNPAGSTLDGSTQLVEFNFSPLPVNNWSLDVGSTPLAVDYFDSADFNGTLSQVSVPGLPTDGTSIVYFTLYYSLDNGLNDEILQFSRISHGSAPPPVIVLTSPVGQTLTQSPAYTWDSVAAATYYLLWVNDAAGNNVHQQWYTAVELGCDSGGACTASPALTLIYGNSRWWVRAWNPFGIAPWSASQAFTVSSGTAPGPVLNLNSPSGVASSSTPTYDWDPVSDATWYLLWVNDLTGTQVAEWHTAVSLGCADGITSCSITPTTTLVSGSAIWWVRSWNDVSIGPWSSGQSFTVP